MRRERKVALAMAAGCLLAMSLAMSVAPLRADDSAAAIAAGGLVLVKNDQIRMVSEVLRIAPRLVEVEQDFENTSGADLTTEVAFPLPDLDQAAVANVLVNIPVPRSTNFVGFQVSIDGREIKPDVEVRAFVKSGTESREITDDLKRLGVDAVSPVFKDPRVIDALLRLSAIGGDQDHASASWTTKVKFHWSQRFPAGKRLVLRQRYQPIYGSHYVVTDGSGPRITKNDQKLGGQWCFDQSFNGAELRLLDRQYAAAAKAVTYDNVQYVLKSGANWQGPIGRFELQIDKAGADLVSTCPIPGLQLHRAPHGFNAMASNYTPTSDLDILFVSGSWPSSSDGLSGPKK